MSSKWVSCKNSAETVDQQAAGSYCSEQRPSKEDSHQPSSLPNHCPQLNDRELESLMVSNLLVTELFKPDSTKSCVNP